MAMRVGAADPPGPSRAWIRASLCCLVMALLLYALSPMAALWSLRCAVRDHDVAALDAALDWRSVRAGLKRDFGPGLSLSLASTSLDADALPGFGESFATTIVSHAVDDSVTPQRLAASLSGGGGVLQPHLAGLGFLGPFRFEAAIRLSDDPAARPLRLSMRLRHGHWLVTRVQLPDAAFQEANRA